MYIENDDKICMNCQHRDFAHEVELPVTRPWGWSMEVCAPCLIEASECDAGPGVHMYAEDGDCRYHADAFEPSDFYLEEIHARAANE